MVASRSRSGWLPSSYRDDGLYDPWLDRVPGASAQTIASEASVPLGLGWRGLETIAAIAWLVLAANEFSQVIPDQGATLRLLLYSTALVVSWVLRTWSHAVPIQTRFDAAARFLTPLVLAIGFLCWATDIELVARLKWSERNLLSCVAATRHRPSVRYVSWGRPAGLFRVASVVKEGGCTRVRVVDEKGGGGGLLFCPGGLPPGVPGERIDHLTGPWWRYVTTPIPAPDSGREYEAESESPDP